MVVSQMAGANRLLRNLEIEQEERIAKVRESFASRIALAKAEVDACGDVLEDWALAHSDDFGEKRSVDFRDGTVGFRKGNPKLSARGKTNWETILERLRGFRKGAYVRIKEEADKESLLADAKAEKISDEELGTLGLKLAQGESFFVDFKS